MGQSSSKRKQSLYFPEEMLREIQGEAMRQDRSLSWIVQRAWTAARPQIERMPGTDDFGLSADGSAKGPIR
ncbi:MAG TPA: TIGR04563 family protein [Anaeromyxobacter sp.]|nr:TIGR04563 family protein [Anaeromyxobacter sp.]